MPGKGQYECKASYWWFSMHQVRSTKPNVDYYPYGDDAVENLQWEDYSINWSSYLQRAIGANGDLSKTGVKGIFNGDIRQVTEQMLKDALDKMKVIRATWKSKYPPAEGKERPTLGINGVQMARCPCCFDNPEQYNDHMKSIHGIETSLSATSSLQSRLLNRPNHPFASGNKG